MTEDKKMQQDTEIAEDFREDGAEGSGEASGLDRLGELEADLERARQDILYAQADTQNVRRRLEKEIQDARAYASTAFARDVLSVSDNLGRALAAIPAELHEDEKWKGLIAGLEATGKELESAFRKNGIEKIEAMGQMLDPNRHQAMIEMASDAEPGTIVQEMQAGYMIKDRLLRPALVAVAKKPE